MEKKSLLGLVSGWKKDEELAREIEKAYNKRKKSKLDTILKDSTLTEADAE